MHFLLYLTLPGARDGLLTLLNLQITIFTTKEICLLSGVEYKEYFMVKSDDDSVVTSVLLKCRILSISFLQLFVHLSHRVRTYNKNSRILSSKELYRKIIKILLICIS